MTNVNNYAILKERNTTDRGENMRSYHITKKDTDGTKYEIRISIVDGNLVIADVGVTLKGKRKVTQIAKEEIEERQYGFSLRERTEFAHQAILERVPYELLEEALQDAWKQFKPKGIQFHLPS